jgi:hypothetical protein
VLYDASSSNSYGDSYGGTAALAAVLNREHAKQCMHAAAALPVHQVLCYPCVTHIYLLVRCHPGDAPIYWPSSPLEGWP